MMLKKLALVAILSSTMVAGCTTAPAREQFLRPDLIIQYEPGQTNLDNAPVISEAIFSLLKKSNSEILIVGVSSNNNDYAPALAADRVQILTENLNAAGIPDYKIHKMTRWSDGLNQIEIYGLADGWRSMPTDMMNYAFQSSLPKRQFNVVNSTKLSTHKTQPVNQVVFREGDLVQAVKDVAIQLGWFDVKNHISHPILLDRAVVLDVKTLTPPVSASVMQQVLDAMISESNSQISYRLHIAERIIVLTNKKTSNE